MSNKLHTYQFGPYQLNAGEKLLLRDGEEIAIKPKVVDTLLVLITNRGHVVSKDELLKTLWPDSFVEESNLTHNISLLRKVLEEKGSGQNYIQTVPKRGYRFIAEVTESFQEADDVVASEEVKPPQTSPLPRTKAILLNHKIAVFCVCLALLVGTGLYLAVWRQRPTKAAPNNVKLIAVVPFTVVGDKSNDEFLGLGMADSLINRLNSLRQLTVLPTSSVARFTGGELDAREIGKKLQADAVLEGTVQHLNNRVLVTGTLIDLRNGNTLWAGKFDEQFTDIFLLQDSISEKVVRALEIELSADRQNQLAKRYTNSTEAYQLYSIGLHHWNKRTAEGLQKALELFRLATEKDPQFALAFAALADVYVLIDFYGYDFVSPPERRDGAVEMAQKALTLDDDLAESHAAMGAVFARFMKKYATAEKFYKRALNLNPNFGTVYVRYGYFLIAVGRIDEALQQLDRAREFDPLSATILTNISACYLYRRKHAEALKYSKLVLDIDPDFYQAFDNLASAYMYLGMYAEAEDVLRKIAAEDRTRLFGEERLAYLLAYVGRRQEAQELLNDLVKRQQQRNVELTPSSLAQVYAVLGEPERAVKILNANAASGDLLITDLRFNEDYDSLRSTRSFQDLVQREQMKLNSRMN
ncbi:MAG TPA: winged helix-turn-helix domain-containing protein [Pyrinomonadaceae bacterium]|nr:winged helix-turn-helix domain-containing protein [Pyrinomonadaceae bacterium]